jgi:TonB family protein
MKQKIFIIILVLFSLTSFSQNQEAIKYFNLGEKEYDKQEYKTADSLFRISAKLKPKADIYLKLASIKKIQGDTCGFCENLKEAVQYGDKATYKLYSKHCFIKDTIKYVNVKEENVFYYCISSHENCSENKTYLFYKKYQNNDSLVAFSINQYDSVLFEEKEFLLPTFDIEKAYQIDVSFPKIKEMPTFPGGDAARIKFISENITYPREAKENNIQGTVFVTFIVQKNGELKDIRILMGIGSGCNEECVRVIKMIPKWNPGKFNGKPVDVLFHLPIKFTLN